MHSVWNENVLDNAIRNVFDKMKTVLDIIIRDDGSIERCETHYRGSSKINLLLTNEERCKLETWQTEAEDESEHNGGITLDLDDGGSERDNDLLLNGMVHHCENL